MISPDPDTPPFASDPHCQSCGKPWIKHDGISLVCINLTTALTVMKAAAIQTRDISEALIRIVGHLEQPHSPKLTKAELSGLLDDLIE